MSASLAAISGIVLSSRMSAGSPTLANEFLLPAIAAVIIILGVNLIYYKENIISFFVDISLPYWVQLDKKSSI